MATRQRTDPAGSTRARGAARWHSRARIRSLVLPLLPLVLGCCCITLAHCAMEEMMIAPIGKRSEHSNMSRAEHSSRCRERASLG